MRSIDSAKREQLLAELRAIQNEEPEAIPVPVPDLGDSLKNDSYRAFVEHHPEWPGMYAQAKELDIDPLDHWLRWVWRNERCAACGKQGHKHHPACRCRICS